MASLDERVAYLERRMEVHTAFMADLRADLRGLRTDLRAEIGAVRAEMGQLRSEMCADLGELRSDMRRMDQKIGRHFIWLVGVLVGVLLALVGLALQIARLQPL